MNVNDRLSEKIQKQFGGLIFELLKKDSIIEDLEEKLALATEKKEEENGN